MGCVLRAIGLDFDPEAFLAESEVAGATTFHRGDPAVAGAAEGQRRGASGFNVPLGRGGLDDLDTQIRDAVKFLRQHEDELRRLSGVRGVEEVGLDFGIRRRDVAAQTEIFPAELLWQAGALDIDLVVTHHTVAEEPPLTPN
jgi:hypothetical protein